ncbi:hypothetical protein GA707_08130 [Nostocoides sp. F2B08]|uniref:hypothetical protein n=1 Tax=Nostocoides sp. F2B08 TaxID=2653936 RepID=UPI0012633B46|nr:hypothetical protein [Tetrasphaera sp. F2B08]KAB7744566.1 hypothetical protein GA707_08130 [Tetrasphaera sp. F2B08]
MPPPTSGRHRRSGAPELLCLGLALLVAGALLGASVRPGYALFLDHVTVPSPTAPDWHHLRTPAGLRAWPLDGVLWAWSLLLPTWLLQHLFLLGSLVGAGVGAGLVLRHRGPIAMGTATVVSMANPYVIERLLLGQPVLLIAYATLPWLVITSRQASVRRRVTLSSLAVLVAALTPWGAVLAGTAAVLVAMLRRRRPAEVALQAAVSVILCLPWLVPALAGGGSGADPSGARAFRLADDTGLGAFASALVGGGVWSAAATLGARSGAIGVVGLVVVLALGTLGLVELARTRHPAAPALSVTAVGIPVITALLSGPLLAPWTALQEVPGVALFRDLHRMLAPSVVATVFLVAIGTGTLVQRVSDGRRALEVPLAVILPTAVAVVLVPGAPERLRAAYDPQPFSPEWEAVVAAMDSGRVLTLPWQPLRRVTWMPQTFLDPTARALPGRVLSDGTLTIERDGDLILVADSVDLRENDIQESAIEAADDTLREWLSRGGGDPIPSELLSGSGIEHVVVWRGSPGVVPDLPSTWAETFSGADFVVWSEPSAASR